MVVEGWWLLETIEDPPPSPLSLASRLISSCASACAHTLSLSLSLPSMYFSATFVLAVLLLVVVVVLMLVMAGFWWLLVLAISGRDDARRGIRRMLVWPHPPPPRGGCARSYPPDLRWSQRNVTGWFDDGFDVHHHPYGGAAGGGGGYEVRWRRNAGGLRDVPMATYVGGRDPGHRHPLFRRPAVADLAYPHHRLSPTGSPAAAAAATTTNTTHYARFTLGEDDSVVGDGDRGHGPSGRGGE